MSAFSVHPGSIGTDLTRHWLPYGSWRRWLVSWALRWLPLLIGEVKTVPQVRICASSFAGGSSQQRIGSLA